MTDSQSIMKIDVAAVINSRLPGVSRFVPRCVVRWLERTICQEQMNDMLRRTASLRGADFCHAVLKNLGVSYNIEGRDNMPADKRAVFVCNHPLGGLDGIALIDFIASTYGPTLKFPVNDLLMAIEPLTDIFMPVNKHGAQNRSAAKAIDSAFDGPDPIIVFPAGLCSRKVRKGKIADLEWHKMFVAKAIASKRDVIPLHFSGTNSSFFYNFANMRKRVGIKLNIEMVYLPREVFRSEGKSFTITVGKPISHSELRGGSGAALTAARIRDIVYSLPAKQPVNE